MWNYLNTRYNTLLQKHMYIYIYSLGAPIIIICNLLSVCWRSFCSTNLIVAFTGQGESCCLHSGLQKMGSELCLFSRLSLLGFPQPECSICEMDTFFICHLVNQSLVNICSRWVMTVFVRTALGSFWLNVVFMRFGFLSKTFLGCAELVVRALGWTIDSSYQLWAVASRCPQRCVLTFCLPLEQALWEGPLLLCCWICSCCWSAVFSCHYVPKCRHAVPCGNYLPKRLLFFARELLPTCRMQWFQQFHGRKWS